MKIYQINLSIGVDSHIITTPWFSASETKIFKHDHNRVKLKGKRNEFRSLAHFLTNWLTQAHIYEEMKATNKKELKYDMHLLLFKMEMFNQKTGRRMFTRWIDHQMKGKLNSKKRFYENVIYSVQDVLIDLLHQ